MFLRSTNISTIFFIIKNIYFYYLHTAFEFYSNKYLYYNTYCDYLSLIKKYFQFIKFTIKNTNLLKGGFFHGHALSLNNVVQMAVLFLLMQSNLKSICL